MWFHTRRLLNVHAQIGYCQTHSRSTDTARAGRRQCRNTLLVTTCGTSLAPRPPSCWQSPCTPSRDRHATDVGGVVGRASNRTVTSPACHPRLPLVAQRVTSMTKSCVTRQSETLPLYGDSSTRLPTSQPRPLLMVMVRVASSRSPSDDFRGFPSRHPLKTSRVFSTGLAPMIDQRPIPCRVFQPGSDPVGPIYSRAA